MSTVDTNQQKTNMAVDKDDLLSPVELIESIRRYEFGIGADLQGDGQEVVDRLVRKYTNLLETVAKDLNSKESHFLLELVQNADDNHYADGVAPALTFSLKSNELVVSNNEQGFAPKNVRALCSAGESSKENKAGYIGEKGIGFKSVFKVTDTPEIHSNGFHFRFDLSNPEEKLGYVVPHWVQRRDDAPEGLTTVVLPAKAGYTFPPSLLKDINATLLLFLGKLRRLEVRREDTVVMYERSDQGALSTLSVLASGPGSESTKSSANYLRATLQLDMAGIVEPKREEVPTVDVVLAFPLSASGGAEPIKGCQTYAFLPIREFGFTFYIQADFVLISSREGIHEELPWNVRVRDAIAPAFAAAVEEFKAIPALAMSYLRFLPGDGVVDPFFKPVVAQAIAALQETACIPAEGGGWRKPAEILLAPLTVRKLFTSEDALALFGADYAASGFVAPEGGLERLSCRKLQADDILDVFRKHGEWFKQKDLDWKIRFYEYLASTSRSQLVAGMLTAPCIPTADGELATPEGSTVFYPLSSHETYGFEHLLTVVDQAFYARAAELAPDVLVLLSELGVKQDEPYELIQNHLLPLHKSGELSAAGAQALVGHIRYLRDKFDLYLSKGKEAATEAAVIDALRTSLYLATQRIEDGKTFFGRPGELYITSAYRPSFSIDKHLKGAIAPRKLLSASYILEPSDAADAEASDRDLQSWREFFARIGVHDAPQVVVQASGDVTCSDELNLLLRSGEQAVRRAMLECLDSHWGMYAGSISYLAKSGRSYHRQATSFANALRRVTAPTRRRVSVALEQTFHDRPEVRDVLGDNLDFVDAELSDSRFLATCGITFQVNADGCLKRLRQLRSEGKAPREQIRAIYRQLEKLWTTERTTIEAAFQAEPLIVVGRGETMSWVKPKAACWRPSGLRLLDAKHPPLREPYVDFTTFFTTNLRVPMDLVLDRWLDALSDLSSVESIAEREASAVFIYRRLSQRIASTGTGNPPLPLPDWVPRLKAEAIFLTADGDLVRRSPSLYFNDSKQYAELFQDAPNVTLLALAPEQYSAVSHLLEKAEISPLSAAIGVEVGEGTTGQRDELLMQKLREMFMCIARVVYGQSVSRFEAAIKGKLFEALRDLEVLVVQGLALDVSLGGEVRKTTGALAWRGNQLLVDADAPSRVDRVALEVHKLLRLPAMLADIISRVLISQSVKDAEAYLQLRNFSALPPEEALALARALGLAAPVEPELEAQPAPVAPVLRAVESAAGTPVEAPATSPPPTPAASPVIEPPLPQVEQNTSEPTEATVAASTLVVPPQEPAGGGASRWGQGSSPVWPGIPSTQPYSSPANTEPPPASAPASQPPAEMTSYEVFTPANIGWSTPGTSTRFGGRRSKGSRSVRSRRGRLLSYADSPDATRPHPHDTEPDPEVAARNKVVELAAVNHFLEKALSQWKSVEVMPPYNPGFDIKAIAHDGREEYVEVKGQGGAWTEEGVALTPMELSKANAARDRYWLCVVEFATDENRRQLYLVRDPFGLATQFRFDKGWKATAQTIATRPQRPEAGMYVSIADVGKGRIAKVKGSGPICKLHIEFEDGRQSFSRVFNPATMTLSYE